MKLFGEFLLEKGILKENVLLDALIAQIKSQPPVCEVVLQDKLLSPAQILKIMNIQSRERKGFIEACKDQKLWSESLAAQVQSKILLSRKPLGQILVQNGALTLDVMTKALDEFLSGVDKVDETPDFSVTPSAEAAPIAKEEQKLSEADAPHSSGGIPESVATYLSAFTDQDKEDLNLFFEKIAQTQVETMKKIADLIHRWVGITRFIAMSKSEALLVGLEDLVRVLIAKGDPVKMSPEVTKQVIESCKDAVIYLSLFREAAKKSMPEDSLLQDSETQAKYERIVSGLQILKFDLELN